MNKLFCFGMGYSARTLSGTLLKEGWQVSGTCRTTGKMEKLQAGGINAHLFDGTAPLDHSDEVFDGVDHLLVSIPPSTDGDPVLTHHGDDIAKRAKQFKWVGYLSTTGVYGNTDGATVTEESPRRPTSPRGEYRVAAEDRWIDQHTLHGLPTHLFRLAGIYGPGRSVLDQAQAGAARRVDKPGHKFSRIHVDDIAHVLRCSIDNPKPGTAFNVCDNEAAPQTDVVTYACDLLGIEPPPLLPFEEAAPNMSPMALSFWKDNRIVDNTRIKKVLGVSLRYPTYREGLAGIFRNTR